MAFTTPVDKDQQPIEPGGINGGFYKRKSDKDQPSFGVETGSIDTTLKAIEQAGGKVVTPKHSIGEWGFMADFADPEGNLWEVVYAPDTFDDEGNFTWGRDQEPD